MKNSGGFYSFLGRRRGLDGVSGGGPWPVGAGGGRLWGVTDSERRRGLGYLRSIAEAAGALGVAGAGWPLSPITISC